MSVPRATLASPSRLAACLIWLRFIKAAANALRWRLPEPDAVPVYAYWSTAAASTYIRTHTRTHTLMHMYALRLRR